MNAINITAPNRKLIFGIPAAIFLSCIVISLLPAFRSGNERLSAAVIGDLIITAPLLYFFAIRKTAISRKTILRVFVIGLLIATVLLRAQNNAALHFVKTWIAPFVEVFVIINFIIGFKKANKRAKNSANYSPDFLSYCRAVMHNVTGNEKAGNMIASEIAVFYYAFSGSAKNVADDNIRFSNYKENGIRTVIAAIVGLLIIEAIGSHFLIQLWNPQLAWGITIAGLYTCLQLLAHLRAIKKRTSVLSENFAEIRNGLAGDVLIKYDNIDKIEWTKKQPVNIPFQKIALFKGLENHNMLVYLKQPVIVTRIFGIKKSTCVLAFFVDRPAAFLEALEERCHQTNKKDDIIC